MQKEGLSGNVWIYTILCGCLNKTSLYGMPFSFPDTPLLNLDRPESKFFCFANFAQEAVSKCRFQVWSEVPPKLCCFIKKQCC